MPAVGSLFASPVRGGPLEQLWACLAGYHQLTSFNRRQWLRLFPAWSAQEKQEQLELLADACGFWVL